MRSALHPGRTAVPDGASAFCLTAHTAFRCPCNDLIKLQCFQIACFHFYNPYFPVPGRSRSGQDRFQELVAFQWFVQMRQGIALGHGRKLCQTALRDPESKDLFVFHQTDVPQRIERTRVQIAGFACLLRTVCTEQNAFLWVQIESRPIVALADLTADQLRQKSAFAHGAQFKDGLDDPEIRFPLADHVQAVEQEPEFFLSLRSRGRKRCRHLGKVHGKAHPLDGRRDSVKDIPDLCFPDGIHIPPRQQHKLRVTKKARRR